MPSAKVLEQKKQSVVQLTEKLKNAAAGVVVDYKGITVADDTKLRKELREAGIEYTVVKNTLLRFAVMVIWKMFWKVLLLLLSARMTKLPLLKF